MMKEELVFWTAFGLLAYTYVGYPLLIWGLAALRRRPHRRMPIEPTVSVLLIVQNEALRIRERIENLLAMDYPHERLEIVVVSDGSTDDTAHQAQRYRDRGVRVVEYQQARGRPAILNNLVPRLWGEVVVMADIRHRVESATLRELISNFADPRTGAVSADMSLEDSPANAERYEKFIRRCEARRDSTVSGSGAVYAIRRRLFQAVPENSLIEDVLIPVQILRQGYRVLLDPRARAWERAPAAGSDEDFTRKVRGIAGNFQLFFRESWLINPFANRLWLQMVSHRFFRLIGPLCLVAIFVTNLALAEQLSYRVFLTLQILFYSSAIAGFLVRSPKRASLLDLPYAFCVMNWATVMGFTRFLFQRTPLRLQKAKG